MTVREETQTIERLTLSPYAALSEQSFGRRTPEPEDDLRTCYQRDRDRILHCKSFRRLKQKTQVFLSPEGDHYRTRLTHTLEVSQIARTLSRALRLNEDLTEAIALGHDLGHTPFGHAGEYALQDVYDPNFHHAAQSVRVVTLLEREGRGLNLTEEVREGILAHSDGQAWSRTQEGRVVRYADKIAYMNHDIEDAIRGGILTEEDLPWEVRLRFGSGKSRRISGMLQALIQHSGETVQMDEESERHFLTLKRFLFEAVYKNPIAKGEEGKARDIVRYLFAYYVANPHKLPDFYRSIAEEETPARAAADFISGMSDRYCVDLYEGMVIPRSWPVL